MPQKIDEALSYSNRWVDILHQPKVTEADGKKIIEE
jgi:hypothetical protein